MPKLPGINHLNAVKAFEKAGFGIIRQGKHIVMSDGIRFLTIPRHNPVNAFTMAGLVRDAGLTIEEFKKRLYDTAVSAWPGQNRFHPCGAKMR